MVTNYPDTRVAFARKLFVTLLANHYAFKLVGHKEFAKVFDKHTPTDWKTMQEMEAICSALAGYAVNETQSSGAFISSLRPYFRLELIAFTKKKRFKVMDMNRHPRDTKLHQLKKVIKRVEEFTEGGKICFARLKEQIEIRLPAATASQSLATLLDPATKIFANKLLSKSIYKETVDLLQKEHHTVLKAMNTKITEAEDVVATGTENTVPAEKTS